MGIKSLFSLAAVLLFFFVGCGASHEARSPYRSIFDRDYTLHIIAEEYPEYEWNSNAQRAYDMFLQAMNEYYNTLDYQTCSIILYDALDIYPYDARIYIQLAESLSRLGDIDRATDVLRSGSNHLTGFGEHPGVRSYLDELNRAAEDPEMFATERKGVLSRIVGVLTWLPRKVWGLF